MSRPGKTLESLPLELYIQILLLINDLASLRALALASRSFRHAYSLVRYEALLNVLNAQYDGLVEIAEAIAAVRSKQLHASRKEDKDSIVALLDARRRSDEIRRLEKQSAAGLPLPYQPTDCLEVLELLKLHHIAVYLLDDYSRNAPRPHWIGPATWDSGILPLSLSDTEKKRYFRAFYRLQTYGNMFSTGENSVDVQHQLHTRDWTGIFTKEEVWRLFFSPLAPWEVEELGCVWHHFYERNGQRYFEVASDLQKYWPEQVKTYPKLPDSLHALPSCLILHCQELIAFERQIRENLTCYGPAFLYKLLDEEDYMTRRNFVLANARRSPKAFPVVTPRNISVQLPLLYPADCFDFELDVEGFRSFVSTIPEIEQPNTAWTRVWIDHMQEDELLFEKMFSCGLRAPRWNWGYALWDSERLAEWRAPMDWSVEAMNW
ncbi:hypothetical protein BJY04DRAFT_184717 [Aspergillus karnatakaensis]|uniref:uncharacterized protein n=1 Tax=Aspergillus karnatakaensis TaxID=1810916 RepID=UPI003CCD17A2